MVESYDVTSAGVSAAQDRQQRMRVYLIMMGIRVACVASMFFVKGWWLIISVLGAVFLPQIAVLLANEPDHRANAKREAVTPLELTGNETGGETTTIENDPIIIVDAPAEHRPNSGDTA